MKLNTKIVIIILEIALIPLFLMGFLYYLNIKIQLSQSIFNNLNAIAQIQKNRLYSIMVNSQEQLGMVIGDLPMRLNLKTLNDKFAIALQNKMNNDLQEEKNKVPSIKEMFITNKAGEVVVSTNLDLIGISVANEDFFKSGLKQNDVSFIEKDVTGAKLGDVTRVVHYSAGPIMLGGETLGVVVIETYITDFLSITEDYTGLGNTGETLLVKNDGQGNALFLTATRFDPNAALNRKIFRNSNNDVGIRVINNQEDNFSDVVDYQHVPIFASTRFLKELNWGIVVKINQTEALAPIMRLRALSLFIVLFATLLIIIIGNSISRAITNPIKELTLSAKKISSGDLSSSSSSSYNFYTSANGGGNEIGDLAIVFNQMVSKLRGSYANLEKKIADRTSQLVIEKANVEGLAKDLKKFKLAVDGASDQIVITDPEGILIYINKACEDVTGYTLDQAVGQKAGKLWGNLMDKSYYEKMWKTIKKDKKVFIGEIKNKRKNNEFYYALISISPILDEQNNILFFVAIEKDITKEKEIDKAKIDFVSLASHQLRTPLSAIKWYSEMLLAGDVGKLNKEQKKYTEEIHNGNDRMITLIAAFLNVSRLELGTFIIESKPVDIHSLAKSVVNELKFKANENKLSLIEKYDDHLPLFNADSDLLQIILQNLLANAINYTPAGGKVKLTINVLKKNSKAGKHILAADSLVITIVDDGIGIPEKQQNKIFTKLFRADNAQSKFTGGTGLGLYIVKSIIDHSGGKIWFDSTENKGTSFYVAYPLSGMIEKKGTKRLS